MLPKHFTLCACFHFTLVLIHINTTITLLIIPNTDFILTSKCKVGNPCSVEFVVFFYILLTFLIFWLWFSRQILWLRSSSPFCVHKFNLPIQILLNIMNIWKPSNIIFRLYFFIFFWGIINSFVFKVFM